MIWRQVQIMAMPQPSVAGGPREPKWLWSLGGMALLSPPVNQSSTNQSQISVSSCILLVCSVNLWSSMSSSMKRWWWLALHILEEAHLVSIMWQRRDVYGWKVAMSKTEKKPCFRKLFQLSLLDLTVQQLPQSSSRGYYCLFSQDPPWLWPGWSRWNFLNFTWMNEHMNCTVHYLP